MKNIFNLIEKEHEALTNHKNEIVLKEVKEKVLQIIENRPLFVPMD